MLNAANIETFELNYIFDLESILTINLRFFNNNLNNLISNTNIFNQETGDWEIFSANSGILETQGVDIARRTVAKYREILSIPTYNERKREF